MTLLVSRIFRNL